MLPTLTQPKIVKSSSSSRMTAKSQVAQRPLLERGRSSGRTSEGETSDSSGTHTLPRTTGIMKSKSTVVANKRPTRSLSAGGSQEFYGKNSTYSANQRLARNVVPSSRTPLTTRAATGKNTWTGPNTGFRSRIRGNLFQTDLFADKSNNDSKTRNGEEFKDLDLATLIKTALELPSDEDKISHIELALKQLEAKQTQTRRSSIDGQSVSLPYSANNSVESSPLHSKAPAVIKKRKENGITKIPKPIFY